MRLLNIYGRWGGQPQGKLEDETRCIEEVYDKELHHNRQCLHFRGYGPDGLYCKQHAKKHEKSP